VLKSLVLQFVVSAFWLMEFRVVWARPMDGGGWVKEFGGSLTLVRFARCGAEEDEEGGGIGLFESRMAPVSMPLATA